MDLARLRSFLVPIASAIEARCILFGLDGRAVLALQPPTPSCPAHFEGRGGPVCNHHACPFAAGPYLAAVRHDGQPIGHLFWCTGGRRTDRQRLSDVIAEIASAFVGVELGLERLTGETLERFAEITLLHELTAALSGVFDPLEVARIVLARGVETLSARAGAVVLGEGGLAAPLGTQGALPPAFGDVCRDGAFWSMIGALETPLVVNRAGAERIAAPLASLPFSSAIWAPLRVGASTIGVLGFVDRRDGAEFSPADGRLAGTLAVQAGAAIHAGRLARAVHKSEVLRSELEIAKRIQEGLLPQALPEVEGLQLAARCVPAGNIGGDYFDLIPLGGGWLGLVIADVSGHGVGSALMLTSFRMALFTELSRELSPAAVFRRINGLLYRDFDRAGMFVTVFLAVYEPLTGTLSYANAGHNPGRVWHAESRRLQKLPATGVPIGMFADSDFEEGAEALEPGDALLLPTDGLVDAKNVQSQRFGDEELDQLFRTMAASEAQVILDGVFSAFARHLAGTDASDDATVIVARRTT